MQAARSQPRSALCCVAPRRAKSHLLAEPRSPWLSTPLLILHPGLHKTVALNPEWAQAVMQRPPFRSLMLPTHNTWPLMRATCTRGGQRAVGQASRGKKTLPQMVLGGKGAIPDRTLSPTSCPHVRLWAGSFAVCCSPCLGTWLCSYLKFYSCLLWSRYCSPQVLSGYSYLCVFHQCPKWPRK